MATLDELQRQYEARLTAFLGELAGEPGDPAAAADRHLALVRALIHRGVHLAAERNQGVQFCALATFLAEMIGHAHQLQHGGADAGSAAHRDIVH